MRPETSNVIKIMYQNIKWSIGVPTNNHSGRELGPYLLWGGLKKASHILVYPAALLVRVQCFRKVC